MAEEERAGEDVFPAVTTDETFREALRTLLIEADANDVEVRGGWPVVRGDAERAWDIEITGVSGRSTAQAADRESLVSAVTEAVAEREGVDATALPRLYDTIDPGVLHALYETDATTDQRVTFEYAGYTITVGSNGSIVLHG